MKLLTLQQQPVENDGIPSAETMMLDEGGIDLKIDGETHLSASFEGLDPFELAFRVLPEDFAPDGALGIHIKHETALAQNHMGEDELEGSIWAFTQELAKRRGYAA